MISAARPLNQSPCQVSSTCRASTLLVWHGRGTTSELGINYAIRNCAAKLKPVGHAIRNEYYIGIVMTGM